LSKGACAALKEVKIVPNKAGVPEVTLHGDAKAAAVAKGIFMIHLSLSHSDLRFHFSLTGGIVLNAVPKTVANPFRSRFHNMNDLPMF